MHPQIDLPFGLSLHSYGLMLATGLLLALLLTLREGRRLRIPEDFIYNLAFWAMLSGILGSRLFYVIVHFGDQYSGRPLDLLKIWQGGLVFYGGFIGAVIVSWIYIRRKGYNFWRVADMAVPGVALGLVFGRIGCTMAGCCYGKVCPADFPFPLVFPEWTVGRPGVALYPTQPMSSLNALLLFSILWFVTRKRRVFEGMQTVIFLGYYAITRGLIELLRDRMGDESMYTLLRFSDARLRDHPQWVERTFDKLIAFDTLATDGTTAVLRISESQLVGVLMLVLAVVLFFVLRRRYPLTKAEQ
ncbi:MAG: prolipoprotein diacylglyceryl transferase [Candidatus Alcyoniella australis]|nr:prolipoprotein diacylglyceryl transferase [Candidatus Alcyoniella australis]